MALILGSGSPRRAELLAQIGLEFSVQRPEIDEQVEPAEHPAGYVTRMSNSKHDVVRSIVASEQVILTADTIVVLDGEILGKPENEAHGLSMLAKLSGAQHSVLTSVTLGTKDSDVQQFLVETIVQFRTLTSKECEAYWHTGEPVDKAGGYGIQGIGAILVESIQGSYTNVVGLPLTETAQRLREFGYETLK